MKLRTIEEVIDTDFREDLADPAFAVGYLQASLEEAQAHGDFGVFLMAVRDVAKARDSVARVAAHVGKTRSSFYKSLSHSGNPEFATVALTLPALGFRLQVVQDDIRDEKLELEAA